jgi:hypothetical protein
MIHVYSSSGEKTGQDKIFSFLETQSNKELDAIRMKAVNYSNNPIVSTTDISRLGIKIELGN